MTTSALRQLGLGLLALATSGVACAGSEPEGAANGENAAGPTAEVLARVCASPCAGPMARVHVYRDAEKNIGRLRFDGDLGTCSHPPQIYFDAAGAETLTVPERPVTGPEDAAELDAKKAPQYDGVTLAETLRCPG